MGKITKHWIIVATNCRMHKSTSGYFFSCFYGVKHTCLMGKGYTTFNLVFAKKIKINILV